MAGEYTCKLTFVVTKKDVDGERTFSDNVLIWPGMAYADVVGMEELLIGFLKSLNDAAKETIKSGKS